MTAYTALKLIKKFNISVKLSKILVHYDSTIIGGTTANLV